MVFPLNRDTFRLPGFHLFLIFLTLIVADLGTPRQLAAQAAQDKSKFVSRFGNDQLKGVELIAEITVVRIYRMGMGVDVAKVRIDRTIMNQLPPFMAKQTEQVVVTHQNEFVEGTNLLLFLTRYNKTERLAALHRLSHLEKNYKDKVRLIEEYVRIENLPVQKDRIGALVRMVLRNLEDESYWIRCYSVYELKGLIQDKKWKFTTGDVAFLARIEEEAKNPAFKKSITETREQMATLAVEGPPTPLKEESKNEKKPPRAAEGGQTIKKAPK